MQSSCGMVIGLVKSLVALLLGKQGGQVEAEMVASATGASF